MFSNGKKMKKNLLFSEKSLKQETVLHEEINSSQGAGGCTLSHEKEGEEKIERQSATKATQV